MQTRQIIFLAVTIRIAQALLTRTFFQPDEYFQSLEVAHRVVFGYGHLTWEWSIEQPIRSIVFPSLWIPVYWILKITNLHETSALIWGPKILQGLFASITDIAVCRLSRQLFGRHAMKITLLFSLSSFFHSLALVRTLSNSLETSLTTLALSYWPLEYSQGPDRPSPNLLWALAIAAIACAVRPTNAILWAYLWFHLFLQKKQEGATKTYIRDSLIFCRIPALLLILGSDSLYFDRLTFTPLNFVRVNLSSVSLFYGGNPWHYYLTQAIPILLTTSLPSFVHGIYLTIRNNPNPPRNLRALRTLLNLVVWTLIIYSLAGHKEWRFIHPLLPMMHLFCTQSLLSLVPKPLNVPRVRSILLKPAGFLILLPLPVILYTTFIHGRAQIAVIDHLRGLSKEDLSSVGFLMPCHSTPWMAYLHRPELSAGHLWALGCEPPLGVTNSSLYIDQSTAFHLSPADYVAEHFPLTVDPLFPDSPYPTTRPGSPIASIPSGSTNFRSTHGFVDKWRHSWPERLIMFGVLPKVQSKAHSSFENLLKQKGYRRVWRTWNGFEEDEKRRGGVEVWKWTKH
ncbi:hypothetical protein CPB86DRAFT_704237 [Serendipita vermifera]|nr:hypothetical protein CPB86DRAFT_704237 [Serendipita vermifera]